MSRYIPDILLWLFVINHGIAFGAGLYEQRVILPQWFSRSSGSGIRVNSAAMWSTDTGRKFWLPVTTVPLTLLTLASLAAAWQSQSPRYQWWLGAAVSGAALVGKFGGCSLAAWLGGLSRRDSACVGCMMNTRGLMELIVINVGKDLGAEPGPSPALVAMRKR